MKMASACALAIFSGKIIFIFGIAERLRTLRYPIFTGGVERASGIYRNQNKKPRRAGALRGGVHILKGCAYSLTIKKTRVY